MPAPDLTVVVPCYDQGHFLQDAVDSFDRFAGPSAELVIVDDGSTAPETVAVLAAMAIGGRRVLRQPNAGLAAARNTGIAAARGRHVLLLDADNQLREGYVQEGVGRLDADERLAVVYGDAAFYGDRTGRWVVGEFDLKRLLRANYIDACAVVRKSALVSVGGYDGGMPIMGLEDWDLWLSLTEADWGFAYIADQLFDYRVCEGSMAAACRVPANRKRLYEYVVTKHMKLFAEQLPEMLGDYEERCTSAEQQRDALRVNLAEARSELQAQGERLNAAYGHLQEVHDAAVAAHDSLEASRAEVAKLSRAAQC